MAGEQGVGGVSAKRPAPSVEPLGPTDSMRRLQIGIAGVMAVLLLVGLAGLIGDRAREQAASDPAVAAAPEAAGTTDKGTGAPLEELGVQPVSKNDEPAIVVPRVVKTLPPTTKVPDLEPDPELQRARSKSAQ